MGGAEAIRGVTVQLVVACERAVKMLADDELTHLRIEGAADIADIEAWAGDRLAGVVQVKSRAQYRPVGPADLAEIVRRFRDIDTSGGAARYEVVTDAAVTRATERTVLDPAQLLKDGRTLDEAQLKALARVGLADCEDVLRKLSVTSRYGDPRYRFDRTTIEVMNAVGDSNLIEAGAVKNAVSRLFSHVAVVGAEPALRSRTVLKEEVRELLGVSARIAQPEEPERPELPRLSNIPRPDPRLLSRPDIAQALSDGFERPGGAVQILTGLPGSGKTEAAISFAAMVAPEYRLAWWMPAERVSAAISAMRQLLEATGEARVRELNDDQVLARLPGVLADHRPWLMIVDDLDGPDGLFRLGLPNHGHVVVTSRHPVWGLAGSSHRVDVFTEDQALQVLLADGGTGSRDEARDLATMLGWLPLAVSHAAAHAATSGQGFAEVGEQVRARLAALGLDEDTIADAAGRYEKTVEATLGLLLDAVADERIDRLVGFVAQLGPEPIPRWLLERRLELVLGSDADRLTLDRSLAKLNRAGVVRIDELGITMHRLTAQAARERLEQAGGNDQRLRAAAETLRELFPTDALNTDLWAVSAVLAPHAHAVLERTGALQLADAGWLATSLCAYDHIKGRLQQAIDLAQAVLDALPANADAMLRAQLLHVLGRAGLKNGRLEDAVDPLVEALRLISSEDGTETMRYATVEITLGAVLAELNDDDADPRLSHALAVLRKHLPPNDVRIARTLIEIAGARHAAGKQRDAEVLEREALEILEAAGTRAGVDLARGLGNLAGTLAEIPEREEEAREVALRALDVTREVYGERHPEVAYALTTLGALMAASEPEQALRHLEEALEFRIEGLGHRHEQVAYTLVHIGDVLLGMGEAERALVWLQQAEPMLSDAFGEAHPETATASCLLGRALAAVGRKPEAREALERGIFGLSQAWGAEHPDVREARDELQALDEAPTP